MATPLDVVTRKAGAEYHQEPTPALGGVDYDSNDSTIAKNRFRELHNFRISQSDDIELRTGYQEYLIPPQVTEAGAFPRLPVAKMEYVLSITNANVNEIFRFDVTAVWTEETGALALLLIDKRDLPDPASISPKRTKIILTPISVGLSYPTEPIVGLTEYQNSIVVTVFGDAVYEVLPNELTQTPVPLPELWTWTVQAVGKNLTELPRKIDVDGSVKPWDGYALTTTGAFYPYLALTPAAGDGVKDNLPAREQTVSGEKEPTYATLDIGIKYFRSDNPGFSVAASGSLAANKAALQQWAFPLNTEPSVPPKESPAHAQTRGWSYRFVNVYSIPDAKGNKRTVYGKPSADMPVRDTYYAPAQLTDTVDNFIPGADGSDPGYHWLSDTGVYSMTSQYASVVQGQDGHSGAPDYAVPSFQDFLTLSKLVRQYLGTDAFWGGDAPGSGGDIASPFFFTAWYLGWRSIKVGPSFSHNKPYRNNVLASDLKRAPLTMFAWSDFPQALDADPSSKYLTEIRIYRTAHSEPGDVKNISLDPLFIAQRYGYVGSVKPDTSLTASFTDDISDDAAMGTDDTADLYDGYLKGQFSGQIIRDYNQKLVLGNTKTTYRVTDPWIDARAFARETGANLLPDTINKWLNPTPIVTLWMSYVDRDGHESAAVQLTVDGSTIGTISSEGTIIVQMPRGYEDSITAIKLYVYNWTGSGKYYIVGPKGGYPLSVEAVDLGSAAFNDYGIFEVPALPTGDNVDAYEPGEAIWSDVNVMYQFPPLNAQLFDQHSGITVLEVIMGRLWVYCERSTHMGTLSLIESQPELEEETKWIGAISRFAYVKSGGVVFFLSANGMYYAQGSGTRAFPAHVSQLIRPYLQERIPGIDLMANVRRASLGIIGVRDEIWLHIPSSVDLGGQLPHLTVLFKFPHTRDFYNRISESENYTFDLTQDFGVNSIGAVIDEHGVFVASHLDPATYHSERVILSSQSDGTLWAASKITGQNPKTISIACDRDDVVWPGVWSLEKPLSLGLVTSPKQIRMVAMKAVMDTDAKILTGVTRMDGGYDMINGHLDPQCTAWQIAVDRPLKADGYAHVPPANAFESMSLCPYIRIVGGPTAPGSGAPPGNTFGLQGMEVYLSLKHHHPA